MTDASCLRACAQVQNTIFPAIFGVFYTLIVLLPLLAIVLLAFERPGAGGAFVVLTWFWLVVMMLAGPGAPLCESIQASGQHADYSGLM